MNRKLQELAYRNVKKYKKHYLFVSILIFCVSTFFISCSLIWNNYYVAQKYYDQEHYGEWYYMVEIVPYEIQYYEIGASLYDSSINLKYGYIYNQGRTPENYRIGNAQSNIFELCKLDLLEGRYPDNVNEIMISSKVADREGIDLNDSLSLSVNYGDKEEYKIVGIIKNSQDNIFPDIYTCIDECMTVNVTMNYPVARNNDNTYNSEIEISYSYNPLQELYNEYGYISSDVFESFDYSIKQLTVLFESLVLVVFALLALTTTSLKRRNKEFALCRGIGMTGKQLFSMVFYEMLYSTVISVMLASIVSTGVSYVGSVFYFKSLGYFVFDIPFNLVVLDIFILFVVILLSMLIPIYSSSKNALTGVFDSKKFKHIQVRYKKLKYQTRYRLALREMIAHKKITLCLFSLLAFVMIFYAMVLVKPDFENKKLNEFSFNYYKGIGSYEDVLRHVDIFDSYKDIYDLESYTSCYMDSIFIVERDNKNYQFDKRISYLKKDETYKYLNIDGRYPENDTEVLVSYTNYNGYVSGDLLIGDTFVFNDVTYTVVGNILPNEVLTEDTDYLNCDIYYYPWAELYVSEDTFNSWVPMLNSEIEYTLHMYYYNEQEKIFIRDQFLKENTLSLYSSEDELNEIYYYSLKNFEYLAEIDFSILPILILISFVSLYYLNKNQMYNDAQDIALMKLIGMSDKEMIKKQFNKAMILTIAVLLFETFWILMLNIYYEIMIIPIIGYLLSAIILLMINTVIYCLPLITILKTNVFDLIKGDE